MKPTWVVRDPFKPRVALIGVEEPNVDNTVSFRVYLALVSPNMSNVHPLQEAFSGIRNPDGTLTYK